MFDNVSKFLIGQYSQDFASWLIGEAVALTELSPTELSLEPIRANALILLQSDDVVLHCEFQTNPDPTMPFRMADYALRVYRRFPYKRMVQVVIYLRPSNSELVQQTTFSADRLRHEFQVVRLWEQPTELFFQRPGLLPYAALSQTSDRPSVLRRVAQVIEALPNRQQQSNLSAASGILAGLLLEEAVVRQILRRDLMQESVVYRELRAEARQEARAEMYQEVRAEILQEARAEVYQEVRAEVYQEVRAEVLQEAQLSGERSLVLHLLTRRVGNLSDAAQAHVEALSLTQLESLGEALLDFSSLPDLEIWLAEHSELSYEN